MEMLPEIMYLHVNTTFLTWTFSIGREGNGEAEGESSTVWMYAIVNIMFMWDYNVPIFLKKALTAFNNQQVSTWIEKT